MNVPFPRRILCLLCFSGWPFVLLHAAPLPPPQAATPMLPVVAEFAASHAFPVADFEVAPEDGPGRERDLLTTLVTLRDGKSSRQWLIRFQISPLTEKEQATTVKTTVTMNLNQGRLHRFEAGASLALDIHTIGPFVAEQKSAPKEMRARARISPDLLTIGLDRSSRAMLANLAAIQDRKKSGAAVVVLSEADERANVAFFPALMAFMNGVQETPGLRDILWAMIEKPSAWSIIKQGGKIVLSLSLGGDDSVAALDRYPGWSAPGWPLYRMSPVLTLNGQPALFCSLFVTTPRPPLLITAGIIGIVAETPGHADRHLDIRILASRRGPAK